MNLREQVAFLRLEAPGQATIDLDYPERSNITVSVKGNARLLGVERLTHIIAKAIAEAGYADVMIASAQKHASVMDKDSPTYPEPEDEAIFKRVMITVANDSVDRQYRQEEHLVKAPVKHWLSKPNEDAST